MPPFNSFCLLTQIRSFVFIIVFSFLAGSAQADPPGNISLNINKYNLPPQAWIYNGISGLLLRQIFEFGSMNTLVCQSDTDSKFGSCPTHVTTNFQAGAGNILLMFCLVGTSTCKDITLSAWRLDGDKTQTPPWVAIKSINSNNVFFYYSISKDQLSLLSTGIWKAALSSNLVQYKPGPVALETWVTYITLNVSSDAHPMIFFPNFIGGNPIISFDFSPVNNQGGLIKYLDMCLYDGGTNSSNISISVQGSNRASDIWLYSMIRNGGDKNNNSDKIIYGVQITNPITGIVYGMSNNKAGLKINNANSKDFQRQLFIPQVGTVNCLPVKLKLKVQNTNWTTKNAGFYNDTLSVTYTPETSSG